MFLYPDRIDLLAGAALTDKEDKTLRGNRRIVAQPQSTQIFSVDGEPMEAKDDADLIAAPFLLQNFLTYPT